MHKGIVTSDGKYWVVQKGDEVYFHSGKRDTTKNIQVGNQPINLSSPIHNLNS